MDRQAVVTVKEDLRAEDSVFRLMTEDKLQFDVATKIIAGAKIKMR